MRRAPAAATSGTRSIGGIDALLALQGVDEPGERRRKAVKRGRSALDALDALKIGLLSGTFDTGALARLKAVTASLRNRAATRRSMPSWPRSSCGSRWNWPRSACRNRAAKTLPEPGFSGVKGLSAYTFSMTHG